MLKTRVKIVAGALLIVLGLVLLLYGILPDLASRLLARLLIQRGFERVVVQLDRPGLTSLRLQRLSAHKVMGLEHLSLTLEDVQVDYDLRELWGGRVGAVVVPRASILLQSEGEGRDPIIDTGGSSEQPGLVLGALLQPIPRLPLGQMFLDQVRVHRDRASGPFREMTISGTIQEHEQVLTGALTFKGLEGSAYQLRWMGRHAGAMTAELYRVGRQVSPVVAFRSEEVPSESEISLRGTFYSEFHELAPLLALLIPLGPQVEQVSGTVAAEWSGTAAGSASVQALWLDPATKIQGRLQLKLALPEWPGVAQTMALFLNGKISGNGQRLDWTLDRDSLFGANVSPAALKLPDWLVASQDRLRYPLTIDLPSGVQGSLISEAESPSWSVEGPVRVRYGNAATPMRAELITTTLAQSPLHDLSASGRFRLDGKAGQVVQDTVQVAEASWDLAGDMMLEASRAEVHVDRAATVKLSKIRTEQVRVPSASVIVAEPLRLLVELPSKHWVINTGRLQLRAPSFVVKETRVTLDRADLAMKRLEPTESVWNADLTLSLARLAPSMTALTVPPSDWRIHAVTDPSTVTVEVDGTTPDNTLSMNGIAAQDVSGKSGTARLHLGPIRFEAPRVVLSKLVTPWAYPFDISRGEVSSDVDVNWTGDPRQFDEALAIQQGRVTVSMSQLDGRYQTYEVRGLSTNTTLQINGTESLSMPEPARVNVASVKGPVEVTKVSCEVQVGKVEWTDPSTIAWVELRHLRAGLFGGQIVSEGLRYDPTQPTHRLTLQLHEFDVQKLLNLEQQKGLEGTGILDGTLPMVLSVKGVVVQDGSVEARPPGGVIRYRPVTAAGQSVSSLNSNMETVLQALSDFHYNVLAMSVQYQEDGNLLLNSRLEGQNPGWQNGRPVHFNLNVQENIPALLKTLETVTRVEEALTERLDRGDGDDRQSNGDGGGEALESDATRGDQ